jgi:DNA-binding Lrp family transcriptional regulator
MNGQVAVEIPSTAPRGLQELRERNRLRVIEALRLGSPLTQAAISRITGLSRTTVSAVVNELKRQGLIGPAALASPAATGARPGIRLHLLLRGDSKIDLTGGSSGLADENAKLLAENARLAGILESIEGLVLGRIDGSSAAI